MISFLAILICHLFFGYILALMYSLSSAKDVFNTPFKRVLSILLGFLWLFFIACCVFFILAICFESPVFFLVTVVLSILGIVSLIDIQDKVLQKEISSLTQTSGLNVTDIKDDTATIKCFNNLPDQTIILEFKIFDVDNVKQLIVNKSDQQLVVLNKDNIDEFYPDFNCLAKV